MRCQGLLKIFRAPIHRAHRAVIFAIAHLSCFETRCSSKRGLEIACRPSVCDVGGSGPHRLESLETNFTNNYPNTFALRSPNDIHLLPGEHGEIWGRLEVGWEKVACWSTKTAISLKRVKREKKLLWRAYRNSLRSFERYDPRPPTASPAPRLGVHTKPHRKLQSLLSQERVKLRTSNLARTITGSIRSRKLSYRKDDRAMRPMYENCRESLTTPTATFP